MKKITLFIFTLLPSLMFSQVILQDEFELSGATAGSAIFGYASGTSTAGSTGTVAPSTRVPDVNATGNFYFRQYLNESGATANAVDFAKIFDTDGTTNGVLRTAGFGTVATMDITNPKVGTTYSKPTKLKMTVTFDCGALTTNGDYGRGVLVGYYKSFYVTTNYTATSFTDNNNGITYTYDGTNNGNLIKDTGYNAGLDFFGFIINANTGQINLWNGQKPKNTTSNAYQAYKGTWVGGTTMHTISYVVDTVTGGISDFVFDGDSSYNPWTTAQFPTATFPVFTNANTNFVGLGSISSASAGNANFYSFKLENAVPLPNTAPVAVADAITVAPGGTSTTLFAGVTSVLTNDTDAEGTPLTAAVVTSPTNGSLTLNSNGTFSYVHNGSATTSDSFTYKANDGALDSNTVTVTITIGANNAPVANNDAFSVKQGGTVVTAGATSVLTNDTDAEGSPLTATVVTSPANGTLTLNANGTYTYLHNNSATTTDSFTYKANDGTSDSDIATVNITITAPVATTNTWTGGTSTDFLAASNWTASDAPNPVLFGTLATFTVPTGTANSPVLNSNYDTVSGAANCVALNVNSGAVLAANANIATSSTSTTTLVSGTLNINAGATCDLLRLYIGNTNGSTGIINVNTGGTLSGNNFWRLGAVSGSTGTINIDGGTFAYSGANGVALGHASTGNINLNSGTATITGGFAINSAGTLNVAGGVWNHGTANINNAGTINITGGTFNLLDAAATINATAISATGIINIAGGTLDVSGPLTIGNSTTTTAAVTVNLNSGTMNIAGALAISAPTGVYTGLVNIDAGSIVLTGDQTAGIAALVTAGRIAVSGAALTAGKIISNTYDSVSGKTTVIAGTPLGVNDVVLDANTITVYSQNQSIKIQSGNVLMADVKVYDLAGRLITGKKSIGTNETDIAVDASNEVYLVKVTTADGKVVTKKVMQ
jgi:VCBS repeat-containing protein